jgi:hypothetical protein
MTKVPSANPINGQWRKPIGHFAIARFSITRLAQCASVGDDKPGAVLLLMRCELVFELVTSFLKAGLRAV